MDNEQERDRLEEWYNEQLLRDYSELGFDHAINGLSRRKAKRWCSVSLTVSQERDYWKGYKQGEIARLA